MITKMYCMASHDFQWQMYPFVALLRKYWCRDLHIIYYCDWAEGKLPKGVEVRQVPLMKERSEEHWDWKRDFGDGFASILRNVKDQVMAVSMLDYWLVNYANLEMIDSLERFMKTHPNVVRAALGPVIGVEQWSYLVENWEGMDILSCKPKNNFNGGVMFNVGLFNREATLQVIKNTPVLDSEIMGWKEMQERPDLMSVWVRDAKGMYDNNHATVRTTRETAYIGDVPREEDRELIKSLLPESILPRR